MKVYKQKAPSIYKFIVFIKIFPITIKNLFIKGKNILICKKNDPFYLLATATTCEKQKRIINQYHDKILFCIEEEGDR